MQDPSLYAQIKPQFPEQEQLKCPRCESINTKFCYYNNYNLSQPRHFCKDCRRYWTKGGALRNIPVGGGSRKNNAKRSSVGSTTKRPSTTASPSSGAAQPLRGAISLSVLPPPSSSSASTPSSSSLPFDHDHRMLEMNGSFSSLLTSNGQFGNLFEGMNPNLLQLGGLSENTNSVLRPDGIQDNNLNPPQLDTIRGGNNPSSESILGVQSSGDSSNCWNGGNDWPNLAIYTPGSSFQ